MTGTVEEIIDHLNRHYKKDHYILVDIWNTFDVIENFSDIQEITQDEAGLVLDMVDHNSDPSIGINWDSFTEATFRLLNANASK